MPGIISETGKELIKKTKCKKAKTLLQKIFSSKYDNELDEMKINLRNSTCKILGMINDMDNVILKCTNAINNLVLLILTNDNEKINMQKVKYNLGFYLNLADRAMKSNDHQTAVLIKTAVENSNIKRLKIKYNKKMKRIYDSLENKYGNINNLHKHHLNDILKNGFVYEWLPSILVLNTHTDKEFLYHSMFSKYKNIKNDDKTTETLLKINECKYHQYKDFPNELSDIYIKDTLQINIPLLKKNKINSSNQLLHKLSFNIEK